MSTGEPRLGAVFPQTELGREVDQARTFARGLVELGFDHLLCYDHVLGADVTNRPDFVGRYQAEHQFHEIMVLFGYLAGVAPELGLATTILVAPQRQTALVAKQAAEIDILTGGRFRLGVGIGWNEVEFEALGMGFKDRGNRLEEQIELLRRLWQEPVVSFSGKWHQVVEAGLNPLPVQRPIPIWIGGWTERALRRAARLADGYFPQRPPAEGWPATIARIRGWVAEAGRDPAAFGIEPRIEVGTGAPGDWRRAADEWRALGVSHVALLTLGGDLRGADEHLARLSSASPRTLRSTSGTRGASG